jgi:hypothetical protein
LDRSTGALVSEETLTASELEDLPLVILADPAKGWTILLGAGVDPGFFKLARTFNKNAGVGMPASKFRSSNIAFTSSFSAIEAILTGSSTSAVGTVFASNAAGDDGVRGGVASGGRVESGERGMDFEKNPGT